MQYPAVCLAQQHVDASEFAVMCLHALEILDLVCTSIAIILCMLFYCMVYTMTLIQYPAVRLAQ